ncbi:MAG: phosphotransferase, partial [Pseudomonadota bacterium]
ACARLAGPNLNAFVAIARTLREAGLSAPEIFAADPATGFALIEDLGDNLFVRAVDAGADEAALYRAAIDALIVLRNADIAPPHGANYRMLDYDRTAMEAEVDLLSEWYWPHKTGATIDDGKQQAYNAAWRAPLDALSAPHAIVLRDFHAENLLWEPSREGARRVGVIDFQDGLYGHAAYDLVSLLQDARRDVSRAVVDVALQRYIDKARERRDFDEDRLLSDYAILGAQRNAKILGIFARLIHRDGKPRYAQFMPRVEAHFRSNLTHPSLADVCAFFVDYMPELAP